MFSRRVTFSLFLLFSSLSFTACSDNHKAKEQAAIDSLMQQHCEKISKHSQEDYIKTYMIHNGNTAEDRKEAIADYQSCIAKQQQSWLSDKLPFPAAYNYSQTSDS